MRLVFAGTPDVALPSLSALLDSRHEVVAVVTRPDARAGRSRALRASAVAEVAAAQDVEVLKPVRPSDPAFLDRLRVLAPDCCPVVAYGGLLPQAALDIPRHGWVNLHFSLLPAWRGAAPVQRALMAGDEVTGATTFRLVAELDAGPTYGLCTETVRRDDTAGTLLGRLAEHGSGLLVATLDGIEHGGLQERSQPEEGISLAPKLRVEEAKVGWARPAYAVDRHIRACTPAPGAWTTLAAQRIKIGPVSMRTEVDELPPGHLAVTKDSVIVGTATHAVELGQVQPAGKPRLRAADWARGLRSSQARLDD
ncbi:MAG: methionyl-tRNA formyltransferase [Propionibacteriales bacterium]|nr:methionyl-tRNA formyltransferase [Propionibacteriales bacterium]